MDFIIQNSQTLNRLLLASQSPRRKKILTFARIPFRVIPPKGVSEKPKPRELPSVLVRRLAISKAVWGSKKYPSHLVLGADTIVVFQGIVFGKPKNRLAAKKMLMRLQGRSHQVWTGVALIAMGGKFIKSHVEKTTVYFKSIHVKEIENYLDTNEPYDKAGAYDIQGTARKWVEQWKGDYFNVMGIPLRWVIEEINRLGE